MTDRLPLYRLLQAYPVPRRTVYSWMETGRLPYACKGRTRWVDRVVFEQLLQGQRERAGGPTQEGEPP